MKMMINNIHSNTNKYEKIIRENVPIKKINNKENIKTKLLVLLDYLKTLFSDEVT